MKNAELNYRDPYEPCGPACVRAPVIGGNVDGNEHQECPECQHCGGTEAPMYDVDNSLICGDCIDRAVDERKEAEASA